MTANGPEIVPVIMSGGAATRLWPLSSPDFPKQFQHLTSARTMIQETALRLGGSAAVRFTAPIVICNRRHLTDVRNQLAEVDVTPSLIVAEPFGRNTAAVAAIAAELVAERHPGALALLLPADHRIADAAAFAAAIAVGAGASRRIVAFGVEPREPHEGYGYIHCGAAIGGGLFAVERFVEKPSRTVAKAYILDGGYYWNTGIFLFPPDLVASEMMAYRPEIAHAALWSVQEATISDGVLTLPDEAFAASPSESFDVAVMERTRRAALAPCKLEWTDIGSWSELWRLGPLDEHGNRIEGDVLAIESSNNLLWSDGPSIGVVGLDDIVVVAAQGSVLVASKARAESVKRIGEAFAARAASGRPPSDDTP